MPDNHRLARIVNEYYEERLRLYPLEATINGDGRYNDQLPVNFTDSYLDTVGAFYEKYKRRIERIDPEKLNENDRITFEVFTREIGINLEGNQLRMEISPVTMPNVNSIPFNQFEGLPLLLGQLGSGTSAQPFKTVQDYDNWIKRATNFSAWADSAIIYFRKGIASGCVLPKTLVQKMIPEMKAMVVADPKTSLFYGPITHMPEAFDAGTRSRLDTAYLKLITQTLMPAYQRLGDFLQTEYLPKALNSTGYSALPQGDKYYKFLVRYWTTTEKSTEEIYQTGLAEVKRIHDTIDLVKKSVGHPESLQAFYHFIETDPRFMPYKTPEEVLNAFRKIQQTIDPNLKTMFGHVPKTRFEIRQTEAFRAASASAEYIQGSADGTRPGIFYVPILDATKFNVTSGMESLFLHEAIPGHHYQVSLQQEDTLLPAFRRFIWYGAYGEGWALYCESLGKELGLYTDPYQYCGALGDEMHRAIRLVVDVAMHEKNMTREQAIKYMTDNESISEEGATAEIERYMACPAQALSYKTGAMKIRELRTKYTNQLGAAFNLASFHDEVLKDGCAPLSILERKMEVWAARQH